MRRSRLLMLVVAGAVLVALAGCGKPAQDAEQPKTQVRNTVQLYNQLLIEGFAKQNMSELDRVATTDQAYREYYQMAAIGEMKRKMIAKLDRLDFVSVDITSSQGTETAVVRTSEQWEYQQISTSKDTSGKVEEKQSNVVYKLKYTLVKRDKQWFVSDVREEGSASK